MDATTTKILETLTTAPVDFRNSRRVIPVGTRSLADSAGVTVSQARTVLLALEAQGLVIKHQSASWTHRRDSWELS